MKRKFLKFGPSKQETQALKQHLAARTSFESEPPTPKSVRPPLPGPVETALKVACTQVVANCKPSHVPYQSGRAIGSGTDLTQHADYAAINAAVRREMQEALSRPVQWPALEEQARVNQDDAQWPSSEMFRYKPTESATDVFHQEELEAMRKQRSSIMAKADELMANLEETQKVLLSPEMQSHRRQVSSPTALSLQIHDAQDSAKATCRSDSVGTVTSTPLTEHTDSAFFDSTAPTSAYVTPACQSKRASHAQQEPHVQPTVTAVDAEWMRLELERHHKAQEEEITREQSRAKDATVGGAETTPTQVTATQHPTPMIQRKPIPRRGTGESTNFSKPTELRQSRCHSRNISRKISMPVSPIESTAISRPSVSGRASASSKHATRPGTGERTGEHRPNLGTTQDAVDAGANMVVAKSRDQSTKSPVQNFSRPSLDTASHCMVPSPDISRPESRSRSADSFRSAVSSISSPFETPYKDWRHSLARRRSVDSDVSMVSVGTRVSEASRGRPRAPGRSPPPPPIDLNRELPPLPGIDQWKPVPVDVSPKLQSARAKRNQERDIISDAHVNTHAFPLRQDSLVNRHPLAPGVQSPPISPIPLVQNRQTVYFDAEQSPQFDKPLAPTNTRDPAVSPGLRVASRQSNRRSVAVMEALSPGIINSMSEISLSQSEGDYLPEARQLRCGAVDKRHSRIGSGGGDAPNFSRKLSSDDYSRMHDTRYQNMLEVTPQQSNVSGSSGASGGLASSSRDKSKAKRHWWQGKPKREETWMDAVVKSGSRSGVLLTDQVAGAPIVRY